MKRYRSKPVFIEAEQFNYPLSKWVDPVISWNNEPAAPRDMSWGYIRTSLGGKMHVQSGDWIIKDPETSDYSVLSDVVFRATYEEIPD